jgi:N-acetylneuraminate lyase
MKTRFGGIWPAMLTPLTDAGQPNPGQIEKLVEVSIEQRLGGLYVLGSTGQWPLLSLEQRQAVAERVFKTAAGRIPVIIHVGAMSTDDAILLARHAARSGADAISSVGPIYYPASPDVVFEHYRRIGEATDLPLFLYHLAGINAVSLDARAYAERILKVPHIGGMKITDRDPYLFGLLHVYTGGRLPLFSGADEVLCHAALAGAVGAVGSFFNLWGPACAAARGAFVDGDFETGRQFMLTFQEVLDQVQQAGSIWSFLRVAMRRKFQIEIGPARPPLGALDRPWSDEEVDRLVARIDEFAVPARR